MRKMDVLSIGFFTSALAATVWYSALRNVEVDLQQEILSQCYADSEYSHSLEGLCKKFTVRDSDRTPEKYYLVQEKESGEYAVLHSDVLDATDNFDNYSSSILFSKVYDFSPVLKSHSGSRPSGTSYVLVSDPQNGLAFSTLYTCKTKRGTLIDAHVAFVHSPEGISEGPFFKVVPSCTTPNNEPYKIFADYGLAGMDVELLLENTE